MKFILAPVIALGLAASTAFAQLTINTPSNVDECEPSLFTWQGGTPPYFVTISIFPQTGINVVAFPSTFATQISWLVNVPSNTQLILSIRDQSGETDTSAGFGVGSGTSTSCNVGNSSFTSFSFGATAASSPTSTGASGNSLGASSSTPNTATGSSPSASGHSAGSTTTSSTSTKSAGASRITGQFAAAGIIGAAMVALLG